MGRIVKDGTKYTYRTAFRAYQQYADMTATQLVDEAVEDSKKDVGERRDIVLSRLIGFHKWLKEDYEVKSRGSEKYSEHTVLKKGLSDKSSEMFFSAIRSFYSMFDIVVRFKGRRRLPKPKTQNKRMIVGSEEVKILINNARTPRDRAAILLAFQGGLDTSTICGLTYGNVAEGLEKNEYPLKIETQRPKKGVDFFTFILKDGINALKAYLNDAKDRGVKFSYCSPLFVNEKGKVRDSTKQEVVKEPSEPKNLETMAKEVAMRSGLVDRSMNGRSFNPLGIHALRESFGSIMTNTGVPDTIVDFWLGQEIGDMAKAYKSVQFDHLKNMYLEREKFLSISQSPVDADDIERKVDAKVDDKIQSLQKILLNYASNNIELENTLKMMGEIEKTMGEQIGRLQKELETEKATREATETAFNKVVDRLLARIKNLENELDLEQDEEHSGKNALFDSQ